MTVRLRVFVAAVWMAAGAMQANAASVEKVSNEKVVVTEHTLQPNEHEILTERRLPSLAIFMNDGEADYEGARLDLPEGRVREGQAVWEGAQTGLRNGGVKPLHFVRVEFRTAGRDEMWGMVGLPPNYKILREDRYARTYEIRIPAGAYEQRHTHHARVVVTLKGAELEHILPDGTKQPSTLQTGEIVWREGATHTGHNMGTTDLWVVAVEPK